MNAPPLVILVMDAGDATLVDRWLPEGRLPTIAGLAERGCFARTTGGETVTEHGTRLSLWSGMPRSQHGYYYFRQLIPGTYDLEPWSARNASARPFWSRLGDRRIAIVDAPEAFPLPGLTGIQLGDWTTLMPDVARFPASSEPPELVPEVERLFGPRVELREFRPHQTIDEERALLATMRDRLPRYGDLLQKLLVREPYELIVAGFYEAHAASHQFWKYRDREDAPSGLANAIRDTYEAVDRELGLLLEQLPGSNVVVLSGMGMKSDYPVTGLMEAFCHRLGYQAAVTGGGGLDARSLARRALPESWRVAISQRLPRDAQERALENRFRNATDWSRTTAFAIPTQYGAFLHVNLCGREPQGIVDPADYESVLARLEDDLSQLVDPVTGGPAVQATVRTVGLYGGGPPESLPDLFVEMEPAGYFRPELVHPRARLTQPPPAYFRDSHHSPVGWLAAAGPSVAASGELPPVDVLDLAPAFLALLGEPVPPELPGAPPTGLLAG